MTRNPVSCYDSNTFREPHHISEREGPVLLKHCAAQVGRMFLSLKCLDAQAPSGLDAKKLRS